MTTQVLCLKNEILLNYMTWSTIIFHYLCIDLKIDYYLLFLILFFSEVSEVHQYDTRSAAKQSYYLPRVRTNYGKFNIRFRAPMFWNSIKEEIKNASLSKFKLGLKEHYLKLY